MKYGLLLLLLSSPGLLLAATPGAAGDEFAAVRKELARAVPNQKPDSIRKSPIAGLYEVVYGTQVLYITKDGKYIVQGDIIDSRAQHSITDQVRAKLRLKVLQAVTKEEGFACNLVEYPYSGTYHPRVASARNFAISRTSHSSMESHVSDFRTIGPGLGCP